MYLLLFLCLSFVLSIAETEILPLAWTNEGLVRGFFKDGAQVYLGIPFASRPQRFKPPKPPPPHFDIHDGTKFGSLCPQNNTDYPGVYSFDEDCLNLNIYAPKFAFVGRKLPVLVYWFGGSFLINGNSINYNQAEGLAREGNVIVVSPNYRLGPLGFLYIDDLTEANDYKNNKVNFAVLDLIRALEWVRDNIYYFGGDPKSITIGGHSSGAFLCSWLTTVPSSKGLYHKVLQLEGPITALSEAVVYSTVVADSLGQTFVSSVQCESDDPNQVMKCLEETDIKIIVNVGSNFDLLPVVDGVVIPVQPDIAITDPSLGLVNPVPTFMVAVVNPGSSFSYPYIDIVLEFGWECFLQYEYGSTELGVLLSEQYSDCIYGCLDYDTALTRLGYGIGDSIWLCPMRRQADFLYEYFKVDVYVAMWTYKAPFITSPPIDGVIHGCELPFLFGNSVDIETDKTESFTPAEKVLSDKFIRAVSHFMRYGNPGSEFPAWTVPELHTVIGIDGFSQSNEISQIRDPPSGLSLSTRCDLFDVIFEDELEEKLDRDTIVENSALKASIWHHSPIKAHSVSQKLKKRRAVRGIQQCPTCPSPPPCFLNITTNVQ